MASSLHLAVRWTIPTGLWSIRPLSKGLDLHIWADHGSTMLGSSSRTHVYRRTLTQQAGPLGPKVALTLTMSHLPNMEIQVKGLVGIVHPSPSTCLPQFSFIRSLIRRAGSIVPSSSSFFDLLIQVPASKRRRCIALPPVVMFYTHLHSSLVYIQPSLFNSESWAIFHSTQSYHSDFESTLLSSKL